MLRIGIISIIPWDFLNQRHQVFAQELSRLNHIIYFFEPPKLRLEGGDKLVSLSSIASSFWKQFEVHVQEKNRNLHVVRPMFLQAHRDLQNILWSNKFYLWIAFKNIKRFNLDFLIIVEPEFAKHMKKSSIPYAYDHCDDLHLFSNILTQRTLENIEILKENSCFNMYTAPHQAKKDSKSVFVPNGVDPTIFYPLPTSKCFDAVSLSNIAEWFDMEAILNSKKRILLIGPMDIDKGDNYKKYLQASRDNILWIPQVEKRIANLWVNKAKVGLVPFKADHPVTRNAMPIKILEYFSCSLPVVSYKNQGLYDLYGDNLTYYGEDKSLDDGIDEALRRKKKDWRSISEKFTWRDIVKKLETKIQETIK